MLADVCRVLEHSNPSMAAKALDHDEKMTLNIAEGGVINRLGVPDPTVAAVARHVQGGQAGGDLAEGNDAGGHVLP